MDRTVMPGECARLLTQLAHLWQRNPPPEPNTPATIDGEIADVLQQLVQLVVAGPALPADGEDVEAPPISPVRLTPRERDVLHWLAKGKSVEDVSELMQISKCTVRTYIQRSLKKLAVSNRTHAVTRALRFGLIEL